MALLSFVTVPLFLPHVFPLGLYPGLEMEVVNVRLVLLVILLIQVVTWENGSGLPGRLFQVHLLMLFQIQGIQRRGDGKDCAPLPPPEERGVRWECLAIFFLDLGLGEVCAGDAWNLPSEGTGVGFFRLVSPAEGTTGTGPFLFIAYRVRAWNACIAARTHARTSHTHTLPSHTTRTRTTTTTTTTKTTTVPFPSNV